MKVVTAEEMQKIDSSSINETGIPGEVLMGYAGKAIADHILLELEEVKRVAVLSGTGNNGGDGMVIAYFLARESIDVTLYVTGSEDKISATSAIYYNICKNAGITIVHLDDSSDIAASGIDKKELCVDAMLGTGFKGEPRGVIGRLIEYINDIEIVVLSVDMPSGLPSNGDGPQGAAILADMTVTIALPKISLVTWPGLNYAGRVYLVDIGFPTELLQSDDIRCELIDKDYMRTHFYLPVDPDMHKGQRGHLLIAAGFDGMEGAAILTSMAAFEMGLGLGSLVTTEKSRNIIAGTVPELITHDFHSDVFTDAIQVPVNDVSDIEKNSKDLKTLYTEMDVIIQRVLSGRTYDAIVLGPGLGRSLLSHAFFVSMLKALNQNDMRKLVIDGDGLYHLAMSNHLVKQYILSSWVITPHFKEASRLTGVDVETLKKNRVQAAQKLAQKMGMVALLKGPATVISNGKDSLINTTGNESLATAGSGDVLTGVIGSLLAQGHGPLSAAAAGTYIHGAAADIYVNAHNAQIMKARDVVDNIRNVLDTMFTIE